MERTSLRANDVIRNVSLAINKDPMPVSVTRSFKTESKMNDKVGMPVTSFQGEEIVITIVVPPKDKYGNEMRSYLGKEEYNKLKDVIEKEHPELIVEIPEEEDKNESQDSEAVQ